MASSSRLRILRAKPEMVRIILSVMSRGRWVIVTRHCIGLQVVGAHLWRLRKLLFISDGLLGNRWLRVTKVVVGRIASL